MSQLTVLPKLFYQHTNIWAWAHLIKIEEDHVLKKEKNIIVFDRFSNLPPKENQFALNKSHHLLSQFPPLFQSWEIKVSYFQTLGDSADKLQHCWEVRRSQKSLVGEVVRRNGWIREKICHAANFQEKFVKISNTKIWK